MVRGGEDVPGAALLPRTRRSLRLQRAVGCLFGALWIPLLVAAMRFGLGWRVEGVQEARREYARLRRESSSPLMVCANHLTMVDSFIIAWALGSPWFFVRHYSSLPWNTPDKLNFASTWWARALIYLMKCVPVPRGGDRRDVGEVLSRVGYLLTIGEVVLIFPEGGRSRTGRVDTDASTYGVGRLVKNVPDCQVLCVYLRGDEQETFGAMPKRGERFRVQLRSLEPKTNRAGLRGSLEVGNQILAALSEMEEQHFGGDA